MSRDGRHEPCAPVSVRIDRIVVDGPTLDGHQARQLREALTQELSRLLGEAGGKAWRGTTQPHLRAPALQPGAAASPATLGRDIARSVFATLESQS